MATQAQKNQIKKLWEILAPKITTGPIAHHTIWRLVGPALYRLELESGPTFTQTQLDAQRTRPVIVVCNYGSDNFTHLSSSIQRERLCLK